MSHRHNRYRHTATIAVVPPPLSPLLFTSKAMVMPQIVYVCQQFVSLCWIDKMVDPVFAMQLLRSLLRHQDADSKVEADIHAGKRLRI
ncbi:hypothetical protein Tco_1335589, partial [Tanacetum coccineum]